MSKVLHKKCTLCSLHKKAYTVCMNGVGSETPKIIIFIDNPSIEEDRRHRSGLSKYIKFIDWLFKRMSINKTEYRIEYSLRCYATEQDIKAQKDYFPKLSSCSVHLIGTLKRNPKAVIVGMGKLSCYQLMGTDKHGELEGTHWKAFDRNCWITYSPAYVFQSPSEAPRIARVLWQVALEAELSPRFDVKVQPFDFEEK